MIATSLLFGLIVWIVILWDVICVPTGSRHAEESLRITRDALDYERRRLAEARKMSQAYRDCSYAEQSPPLEMEWWGVRRCTRDT